LQLALTQGLDNAKAFLTDVSHNNDNFQLANTAIKSALDGSHIITHPKKQNSDIHTNFIMSMEDEHSYAMLATLEGPIHNQLRFLVGIRGTTQAPTPK